MSKREKHEPKGEAPKPGPPPLRLKIDENDLDGALGRIVRAGKPEAKPKRRRPNKRK
jgi:hypothetical protein